MKIKMIFSSIMLAICMNANALKDLSGTYKCSGQDTKDGKYSTIDRLSLDKKNSTDKIAGYSFNVPNFQGGLKGFGVFDGKTLSIYFTSIDKSSEDSKNNYGVMIAYPTKSGLKKIYYEPIYKTGSTGTIDCKKINHM